MNITRTTRLCLLQGVALFAGSLALVQAQGTESLAADALFRIELETDGPVRDLTGEKWQLTDKDGRTTPVEVGESLIAQGYLDARSAGDYRYTVEFDSAGLEATDDNALFLLELGPVYTSDVTRVNGHTVGGYGRFPAPFNRAHVSQEITRRYVVPGSWLNAGGSNRLEVDVSTGTIGGTWWYAGGGIFQGPVTLTPLRQKVLVDYALRDPALSPVAPLLSDAPHLNRFTQRPELNLRLRVAPLNPAQARTDAELIVRLQKAGAPAVARNVSLQSGHWSAWESVALPMPAAGEHLCEVEVRSAGQILYRREIPFVVEAGRAALDIAASPVDFNIPAQLRWQDVSSRTVGSFGARNMDEQGVLDPANWEQDVRGTLATVVHVSGKDARPLLLFTGVQKPPLTPLTAKDYQEFPLGREYDGFADAWPLGFVHLGKTEGAGAVFESADWVTRSYTLQDKAGKQLGQMLLSKLSPAIRFTINTADATFFEDLPQWGLGAPSGLAYAGAGAVRVLEQGEALSGAQMHENWLLVWFNGSAGWDGFDIPWLFVLERKPQRVTLTGQGLSLDGRKNEGLGVVYAMPLYGVRLLEPAVTDSWRQGPDAGALADARRWAKVLPAFPVGMERAVAADWNRGDVFVRERVRFETIVDEWGSKAVCVAPVSPVMALGMLSDNLEIAANADLEDFNLVTAFGPYLGAEQAEEVVYRVSGLLPYVGEALVYADDAADAAEAVQARDTLQRTAKKLVVESRLKEHPWPWSIWRGKFTPGYTQSEYSTILGSVPYLDEPFRSELAAILLAEVNNVFLPRKLPAGARAVSGWKPEAGKDLYKDVTEPLTGRTLTVLADHLDRRAIDTPFWQSYQIYTIWQAAHYLDNWDATAASWEHILGMAELPLHSHDWTTLQSWDFFSGYRIGNGIQESGGMYAGYIAMARMAHKFGFTDERDLRAGLAVLQLVGMNAANTGIDYVRASRPWSGKNSTAQAIARAEKAFASRYVEFNEFTGSPTQAILLPWWLRLNNSYIHDLLPDVMRVYPEVWAQENTAFFADASYDPPLDMVVWMERAGSDRIAEVYRKQVRSPKELERLMAAQGFLASLGAMQWETVIVENEEAAPQAQESGAK